jgi:hypothetical protein
MGRTKDVDVGVCLELVDHRHTVAGRDAAVQKEEPVAVGESSSAIAQRREGWKSRRTRGPLE